MHNQRRAHGLYGDVPVSTQPLRLRWPTRYPRVTQIFDDPNTRDNYIPYGFPGHEGVDFQAPLGALALACADGEVIRADPNPNQAYGAHVRLRHFAQGLVYITVYAHLKTDLPVRVGEHVKAGQVVGTSGNTGRSTGPHLHLTLLRPGATDAGEDAVSGTGQRFGHDILDPTPYLHWPDLRLRATDTLHIRQSPPSGRVLATVPAGALLTPLEFHGRVLARVWYSPAWLYVRAPGGAEGYASAAILEPADGQAIPPPPLPIGRFAWGVHGRADGPLEPADVSVVNLARMDAAKLLSSARAEDLAALRVANPGVFIMVRLFMVFRDNGGVRRIPPAQFAADLRPDVEKFYAQGVRYFEVHNEPNLTDEGFGGSWSGGAGFAAWFLEVARALRIWFPEAKLGFPGLSPGEAMADRPQAMWDFLAGCEAAIAAADWLGVHVYFRDDVEAARGIREIVDGYRDRWPDKLVMVTEYSNPVEGIDKAEKGRQYVQFCRRLEQKPGVGAAFSFVASASDPAFAGETWREEDGRMTPIVEAMGRRFA